MCGGEKSDGGPATPSRRLTLDASPSRKGLKSESLGTTISARHSPTPARGVSAAGGGGEGRPALSRGHLAQGLPGVAPPRPLRRRASAGAATRLALTGSARRFLASEGRADTPLLPRTDSDVGCTQRRVGGRNSSFCFSSRLSHDEPERGGGGLYWNPA